MSCGSGHKVPKVYIALRVAVLGRVDPWEHVRERPEVQGPTPGSAKTKLVTEDKERGPQSLITSHSFP